MGHFRIASANRHQFDYQNNYALSAVNAVCLAKDLSWEASFRLLLNQAHRYGLMPEFDRCVKNMLIEAGYAPVAGFKGVRDFDQLNQALIEKYPGVSSALAVTSGLGRNRRRVCAVRRNDPDGFIAMDTRDENRMIAQLWLPWEEIGARRPSVDDPLSLRGSRCERMPSHDGYRYFQPNPRNNNIGDCVIRAYSAVFDVSWDEALDMLAKATGYTTATLNSLETYRYLASEPEFTYHDRMTRGRNSLTGAEFCAYLTATCKHGERVFAQAGPHHVVGIVPVDTPDGKQYAIMDSWDSSVRRIGNYFVYTPPKPDAPAPEPEKPLRIVEGGQLSHPRFGVGTIEQLSGERIVINFPEGGRKTFAASWVRTNCKGV